MKKVLILILFFINLIPTKAIVPDDLGFKVPLNYSLLFPCPYSDLSTLNVNTHKRGMLWNLYSMKLPLAWEITKGSDKIL